jgi:2,4-dienoyl-CoA reductase-like NADH-dependent reductase (Old Yellow Enzyme family)
MDGKVGALQATYYAQRASAGMLITEATAVTPVGRGGAFTPGLWSDDQIPGWKEVTDAVHAAGGLIFVQLWHAGRLSHSSLDLEGRAPVAPTAMQQPGKVFAANGFADYDEARALTLDEIAELIGQYRAAAERAKTAGFDGVEIHGAHGYVLCQFLSAEINQRNDRWGGSLENRARIVDDILAGVRVRCGAEFQIGLRLSPERFGMDLAEIRLLAERWMTSGAIDYLDMSLWDARKAPEDEAYRESDLTYWFTSLQRGSCRLGVAGKIMTPAQAQSLLDDGCDYVLLGRAAILHHDWPNKAAADDGFAPAKLPVTKDHLRQEGLGETFVTYMAGWKGFVSDAA